MPSCTGQFTCSNRWNVRASRFWISATVFRKDIPDKLAEFSNAIFSWRKSGLSKIYDVARSPGLNRAPDNARPVRARPGHGACERASVQARLSLPARACTSHIPWRKWTVYWDDGEHGEFEVRDLIHAAFQFPLLTARTMEKWSGLQFDVTIRPVGLRNPDFQYRLEWVSATLHTLHTPLRD